MHVKSGDKASNPMPDGLRWPGIALTDEYAETVTIVDRNTGLPRDIVVTRADFLTQRIAKDGTVYTRITPEVVMFGYKIVAKPRFSNIVGLDVDENGALLDLDTVVEAHEKRDDAWRASGFAGRSAATSVADL